MKPFSAALNRSEEVPVFPGCQPVQMSACSLPHRPAVELRGSKRQGRGHHLFTGRGDSAVRSPFRAQALISRGTRILL